MAYFTIDEFIKRLESEGELIRVKEKVSPILEISEINDRLVKNNGKSVLFENTGTEFPVLINMMGSEKRIAMALNVNNLDELAERIKSIFDMLSAPKESMLDKLKLIPKLGEIGSWSPSKSNKRGLCQEVEMENPDLSKIPILKTWPYDGGPFITFPVVHTISLRTKTPNIGMYRMQVMSKNTTGMHWHLHKDGANQYREYQENNKRMTVSVTIGGDPAYIYSATAPLPANIDEYMLAGFLRRKKVKLVKCLTNDIYVPEDVDFVIEGYVDPQEELIKEGPFGDHTGYYSLSDNYPLFHITKITHRMGAIYSATVVGIPPQEDAWIGLATERIFLNPIKMTMIPEVKDMHMPAEGVFHNIVLASIKSTYTGQAIKVMNALWGAGQMMFNKLLFVFDMNIKLTDYKSIIKMISENVHPIDDIYFNSGPMDVLDHASQKFAFGGKMGFDATSNNSSYYIKPSLDKLKFSSVTNILEINDSLIKLGYSFLILKIYKEEINSTRKIASKLLNISAFADIKFVIFMEEVCDIFELSDVVWRAANNIDPKRDCFYIENANFEKFPTLFIDATRKTLAFDGFKRDWPNIVCMDEKTIELVDTKWRNYGLGEFLESPSKKYRQQLYRGDAIAEE